MRSILSFRLVPIFALSALSAAQQSVPQDLSQSFRQNTVQLQVSYTGDASNGFADGSRFTAQQCANTPAFGLGDSSGISTTANFVIMMLDTTCSQRVIHFMQPNFKSSGDRLQLASQAQSLVDYVAPGSRGEKGQRQYTFLMFLQPSSARINSVPNAGDVVDVASLQTSNGLRPAIAGVAMRIDLGGDADCGNNNGGGQNGGGQQQQPSPPQLTTAQAAPPNQPAPLPPQVQTTQQPQQPPPAQTTRQVQLPPSRPTTQIVAPPPADLNLIDSPVPSSTPAATAPRASSLVFITSIASVVSFTGPINLGPIPTELLAGVNTRSGGSAAAQSGTGITPAAASSGGVVPFAGATRQLERSTCLVLLVAALLGVFLGW
ncbi:hypothetical protein P152DRAFT_205657 [Eremomyces bilateralis CBS 781.70]|uniref:Uncharacterized protein n=1 Tax=Eremomyces bilateralis CBS 781.70 TaxID=1392243 RepID=A0A6G1FSY7_9PEZI|nr:uncharacterized protein P152DRAFT_205657 [Eremomyces bilateralis CBS 781.70]KAF1808840.1 hypothetical protein P152DRAFT_205657 [Eremomyces bilateralis CBS 781.70]